MSMKKKWTKVVILVICSAIFCLLIHASPVSAQFSNFMFAPLSPFFMPYMTSFMPWGYFPFGFGSPFAGSYALSAYTMKSNQKIQYTYPEKFSVFSNRSLIESSLAVPVNAQVPFGVFSPAMFTVTSPNQMRVSDQAGTWVGTWQSTFVAFIILFHSGPMNMTLIENPVLNTLSGTCILEGSRFANTLFDVQGTFINPTTFELSAAIGTGGYCIVLTCILTSPTTMTGSYTINIGFGGPLVDKGIFNLVFI